MRTDSSLPDRFTCALLSVLLVTSLAMSLLTFNLSSNLASASPSPGTPENFIIVALADTQYYSQSYPHIFENQTKWIVQKENELNIVFVTLLGDIVQNYDNDNEWQNADNAMSILDNEVSYGILAGNHDMGPSGEATKYEEHFPASRFENYDYWGGSYDRNKNNYQLFSAGGMDFIALNLQYSPPDNVLDWADNVLDNYTNRRAIISTHSFLNSDGTRNNDGQGIWNNLVVPHNNVFLVLCGHILGEAKKSDTLDNRTVHQLLSDYQGRSNGGNGWLRIMKFVPNENKIFVRTYSPYLDQYEADLDSQFELAYPMVTIAVGGLAVSTLGAENVSYTSADLKGELENLGGASSAEVWFQWRESGTPTWENTLKQTLYSPQEFSESLSGLSTGTTYEFRAVADNSTDVDYGSILTFKALFPDSSWDYRKEITIDHAKVNDNLENFPILIDIVDPDLKAHAMDNGDDILFTKSDGQTKIPHEIELYDNSNGHLVAHVKVPHLSTTENTIIFMYYGNPSAPNQENVEGVWDSNYMMVQHLEETSGTLYDSTLNNNDGTPKGGLTQGAIGKINGACDFGGGVDYVDMEDKDSLDMGTNDFSISLWAKTDNWSATTRYFVAKGAATIVRGYRFTTGDTSNVRKLRLQLLDGSAHTYHSTAVVGVADNAWAHLAVTIDRTDNEAIFYVNGVQLGNTIDISDTTGSIDSTENFMIGTNPGAPASPTNNFNGLIDEVRISNVARSAGWISTTFNNENSPSTFYSVGSEETAISVDVSILPGENSGVPGETLTYTVTVKNTGYLSDNYSLENSDNSGWALSLDNDLLTIPAGENRTTTLRVTVPACVQGCTRDNVTVTATSQADNTVSNNASCIAHVEIVRGVEVSISPSENGAEPCNWLEYTVTVMNTGNVADNFDLSWVDTEGWDNIWLEDNVLWVDRCDNENSTTLYVHIPWCTEGCTWDNITVTATSRENTNIRDNDTCRAHVDIIRGVEVSISPSYQTTGPCNWLEYTVTVTNTGNVDDVYSLSVTDNLSWDNIRLDDNSLLVPRCGGENTTTLHIHIPENAEVCTEDNIIVTATSVSDNAVSDNASCIAHVAIARGVEVSVSPEENSAGPCNTLEYTVVVTNTGNVDENYLLSWGDNSGWGDNIWLSDNWLGVTRFRGENTTTLYVHMPTCVEGCTRDNVTVTATSMENENVSDNANCIAQVAIVHGVEVSISPGENSAEPCNTLEYIVTVRNTGNVDDVFSLSWVDNAGWGDNISLEVSSLSVARCGGENSSKLFVHIPTCVEGCTRNNITVTATGTGVENSASCIAHATIVRGVEVLLEPKSRFGAIGEDVVFTVTVKNIGNVWDNYRLENNDDAGWALKLDNDYLEIPRNENRETRLTVSIPNNENLICTTDNVTVVAKAVDNAEVTDNDVATVHAVSSWTGTVKFKLENLYKVSLEKDLQLYLGSKLVVKFYTYTGDNQGESVIDNFAPPKTILENENVPHPSGLVPVEIVRLVLTTDDTANEISTIASFTATRSVLANRYLAIKLEYIKPGADKPALANEYLKIKTQYIKAP